MMMRQRCSVVLLGVIATMLSLSRGNCDESKADINSLIEKYCYQSATGQLVNADDACIKAAVCEQKKKLSWQELLARSSNAIYQIFNYTLVPDFMKPYSAPQLKVFCGTGFAISDDGYVITNYHVVEHASCLYAQLPQLSKEKFELTLIGVDPDNDIALLRFADEVCQQLCQKMKTERLPFVPFGNSDAVQVGAKLLVAGYPLGMEELKGSDGIYSGAQALSELDIELIQTTAPINRGNSGGPLFNQYGEVVGVNTLKIIRQGVEGMGYGIPSNFVCARLSALQDNPVVLRSFWGFRLAEISQSTMESLGHKDITAGALIVKIKKGFNALFDAAGIEAGDILLALDDLPVDHYGQIVPPSLGRPTSVYNYLHRKPLGSTVVVDILRDGEQLQFAIEVASRQRLAIDNRYLWIDEPSDYEVFGGFVFTQVSIDLIGEALEHVGSPEGCQGLLKLTRLKNRTKPRVGITMIFPQSEAFLAMGTYIRKSFDVIVSSINGKKIHTIDDVREAIAAGLHDDYLHIKTQGGFFAALSMHNILQNEALLSQRYGFPLAACFQQLMAEVAHENSEVTEFSE